MKEDFNSSLSYILNEHEIEEEVVETEVKSNGKNFFFSIIIIALIYVFTLYFSEIKSYYNKILNEYILTEKEETKNKIYRNETYLKKVERDVSNKQVIVQNPIKVELKEIEKQLIEENEKMKIELKLIQKELKEISANEKEVVETTPITNAKESFIKMYRTDNFKVIQCDGYRVNKYLLNNTCKSKLEIFLNDNKDALRFEVSTLLGKNDVKNYLKYKAYLEILLMNGISTSRISEMIINMKKHLPENSVITSKNQYIESEENTSSVIVKAYY